MAPPGGVDGTRFFTLPWGVGWVCAQNWWRNPKHWDHLAFWFPVVSEFCHGYGFSADAYAFPVQIVCLTCPQFQLDWPIWEVHVCTQNWWHNPSSLLISCWFISISIHGNGFPFDAFPCPLPLFCFVFFPVLSFSCLLYMCCLFNFLTSPLLF